MSSSYKAPLPDFKLNLVLPGKTFALGEVIRFEVIVDNFDASQIEFFTITLFQNMLQAVTKRRGKKSFKFSTNRIAQKQSGPWSSSSMIWMDFLQIPHDIPSSISSGMTNLDDKKAIQAVDIQYFLRVHAIQFESYCTASEDFPIQIQPKPSTGSVPNSGSNSNVATTYSVEVRTPQHFPSGRLGLGSSGPPQYSTLSLNIQTMGTAHGFAGSSTSLETLPPHYDDLPRLQ